MLARAYPVALIAGIIGALILADWAKVASSWPTLCLFAIAALILGALSVPLARGDAVDTSGSVAIGAAVLLGPVAGVLVAVSGGLGSVATARANRSGRALAMIRRSFLAVAAGLAYEAMGKASERLTVPLLGLLLVAGCFHLVDFCCAQWEQSNRAATGFASQLWGAARFFGWIEVAQASCSVLCVLLFGATGAWGVVVVTMLLAVIRQSLALLVDIRNAYQATIEVLARAMEAGGTGSRSHGEKAQDVATSAARQLGWRGRALEDLANAALFHDVGGRGEDALVSGGGSAAVLSSVEFLAGARSILEIVETGAEADTSLPEHLLIGAYLVCRASDIADGRTGCSRLTGRVGSRLYEATRVQVDKAVERATARAAHWTSATAGGE